MADSVAMAMSSVVAPCWSVYMIQCSDGSLYTGITTDVERRFREHSAQKGRGARYLRGRAPLALVYTCPVGDHAAALRLEYRIKQLRRAQKQQLVTGQVCALALMGEQAGVLDSDDPAAL